MRTFTLLILLCLTFNSCKKIKHDYRDALVGKWKFDIEINKFNVPNIGDYSNEDYTVIGLIEKFLSDQIIIYFEKNQFLTLKINENGEFQEIPNKTYANLTSPNEFYYSSHSGGLGGGVTKYIKGKKIQ